ncbi:MAG: hypothetical protein HY769_02260 [Candidatus Stahlbacteria bacterium]|nr:hypothetical protein [Candidatus Stahlbacteria bacterium]
MTHIKSIPLINKISIRLLVFCFWGLCSCFLFPYTCTYSKAEIENVKTDSIFYSPSAEILPALKKVLVDMGFEIAQEQEDLIVAFPLEIEGANFGKYAVEKRNNGYEPVKESELYGESSVEVHCVIIPTGRGATYGATSNGTKIRVKTSFVAFRKDILYRETPGKAEPKTYSEIEGDFIECRSTGRIERTIFTNLLTLLSIEK